MRLGVAPIGSSTSASALTLATGEPQAGTAQKDTALDEELSGVLASQAYTGRIAETLETRLRRRVDRRLADVGRMLWFDTITGLNNDNTCAGCHSPLQGFGDTQSIAIGIENNGIVGPIELARATASRADGDQHRLLSQADVELPLRRVVRRSI